MPANSPQISPARLPAPLAPAGVMPWPWSTTPGQPPQSTGACKGARAEGERQGDSVNYSPQRGEAMQPRREGKIVTAALMVISNMGSAAGC